MPFLCENLIQYVVDNKDYVLGDTVEKVLYCCYNLGYMPQNDDVLNSSIEIINRLVVQFIHPFLKYICDNYYRDFHYMSGLSIVQACLALAFYKSLPDSLINRVFNIDFIKRLEDEIEMCYSKVTFLFYIPVFDYK